MSQSKFQKGQMVRLIINPATSLQVIEVNHRYRDDKTYTCRYTNPDGSILKDSFLEVELEHDPAYELPEPRDQDYGSL
ncbi:hypothetical protein SPHINGO8BC_51484 [Sphingobacterium multivorum]|uniref:Uncharacterized protein n=1 Tax=Sphingobacterium multivorum TaxID=28454 RepID=A0A654D1P2_SPHMU|nr:hypothetical protein SPHINGO8BC_51484 [Sphingobacterium multivorum]